jgi:arsenite methyltransferase
MQDSNHNPIIYISRMNLHKEARAVAKVTKSEFNWLKMSIKVLTAALDRKTSGADSLNLTEALAKIDRVFGIDRLLQNFNTNTTIPYYTQSELGYRLYHSAEDAIHMALSFDGILRDADYQVQPQIVADQIEQLGAKDILEIGCGKGFNSRLLAQKFPNLQFTGIDLTPLHIKIASQKSINFNNLNFQIGDFNQLDFPDSSYDLVFAFECLCHAEKPDLPLTELFRVLRPGGQLIIFDGYRKSPIKNYSAELQIATQLTEVSMAVRNGFSEIERWSELSKSIGFEVDKIEELSFAIQPTLIKLQSLSLRFFSSYWRSKLISLLAPNYLIKNSVAGLLMPFVTDMTAKPLGYYHIILNRPNLSIKGNEFKV